MYIFSKDSSIERLFDPPPPQYLTDYTNNIVGTFQGMDDGNLVLVFTSNGKCYWYHEGTLLHSYNYSISNTSPQCGMEVTVDESEQTAYLLLVDDNTGVGECYEIYAVDAVLSLRTVGSAEFLFFNKQ